MKKITIATFNVHHWADANHFDNYDRVLKLCKVKNSPSQIDLILKLKKKTFPGIQSRYHLSTRI